MLAKFRTWRRRVIRCATGWVAVLVVGAVAATSASGEGSEPAGAVAGTALIAVDWQGPASLPLRFRNHCRYDPLRGRYYCANHCGRDYQFYYCSRASFGCCRVGYGYCDGHGHLRCAP